MSHDLEATARQCADLVERAKSIVLLSGAGCSTAAGIADFRGPNGLYRTAGIDDPERIFDISYFHRDPSFFYRFHRTFLRALDEVEPTFTHRFFAGLEEQGKMAGIITQNIDSLHQRAGSRKVLEIHGGIWDTFCTRCGRAFDFETAREKTLDEDVPCCDACGGVLKPDVVFFGEAVKHLFECQALARQADLFFVVGSSLVVTPAAFLPAMTSGAIVVVNKGELSHSHLPASRVDVFAEEDIDTFFTAVDAHLDAV